MNYRSYLLTFACLISLTPCIRTEQTVSYVFSQGIRDIVKKCKQSHEYPEGKAACEIYAFNIAIASTHLEAQIQKQTLELAGASQEIIDDANEIEQCLLQATNISPFNIEEKINKVNACLELWKALTERTNP